MDKKMKSRLPPFTEALMNHTKEKQFPFDTPGHHGGAFYNLTEEGKAFTRFYGNAMFAADVSDSGNDPGAPSSHEGVSGTAEKLAAETFGADRAWFVLHGTSVSNRICCQALLSEKDLVLLDRNSHKSVYQGALLQCGAIPVFLDSLRLKSGIIGGIDRHSLNEKHLRKEAARLAPESKRKKRPYRLAVIQLATYDGFIADAKYILMKLRNLCDYILFDAAWAGYEQFLPLTESLSPLTLALTDKDPGLLVTQSVHKQLAGFSQTSQILKKDSHLRGKNRYLPDDVLDNAFLMNISTSPYFPFFSALEMNAFLHRKYGHALWQDTARFAVELRKKILTSCRSVTPLLPRIIDGRPWETYSTEEILSAPRFWQYGEKGNEKEHFSHTRIDPCKILLTMNRKGRPYPAMLLSLYLQERNITPEKCGLHTLLFLIQPGDQEEKAEALVSALMDFENNAWHRPVLEILPKLSGNYNMTVAELGSKIENFLAVENADRLENNIFTLRRRKMACSGRKATEAFIKGNRKRLPLSRLKGKTALECAIIYPPGICAVTAGEKWTQNDISYFLFTEKYMNQYPDFAPEIVGLHKKETARGKKLFAWVLSEEKRRV